MKRTLRLLGILLIASTVPASAWAQATPDATPDSLMAGPGFAEINILARQDAIDMPPEVQTARSLIHFENATDRTLHPLLVRLPEGISIDRALGDLLGGSNGPPSWLLDGVFPGFVGETMPGMTSRAVVDLIAGDYVVLGHTAVAFEVTGARSIPPAQQTPPVDVSVEVFEYDFILPAEIASGPQVWSLTNTGNLPHELLLVWTPDAMTPDDMLAALMLDGQGATPSGQTPPVALGGIGWLSPGMTAWGEVDLPPGSYLVLCLVYDPDLRSTHLDREMVDFFTIENNATPGDATPEA